MKLQVQLHMVEMPDTHTLVHKHTDKHISRNPPTGESASQAHTCLTVRNVNASNTCGLFKCDRELFVFTWVDSEWMPGHEFSLGETKQNSDSR